MKSCFITRKIQIILLFCLFISLIESQLSFESLLELGLDLVFPGENAVHVQCTCTKIVKGQTAWQVIITKPTKHRVVPNSSIKSLPFYIYTSS